MMSPFNKIPMVVSVLYVMVAASVVSDSTKCGPEEFACADGSRQVLTNTLFVASLQNE